MKTRTTLLALVALLCLGWDAGAQTTRYRARPTSSASYRNGRSSRSAAPVYGSVERTKLLRSKGKPEVSRLGSLHRQALLTGASSIGNTQFRTYQPRRTIQ